MTDNEINSAIAEACGWRDLENEDFSEYGVPCFILMGSNNTGTRLSPPDYCHDLNAMHEAEEMMVANKSLLHFWQYAASLKRHFPNLGDDGYIHATARQRAEAFLRTLGKWKEARND